MKILIIGSRGFIGSHCSNHFSQFAEVWECDIVDESRNIYFYLNPENPDFTDVFSSQDFDVCINCSGAANVQNSITNPKKPQTQISMIKSSLCTDLEEVDISASGEIPALVEKQNTKTIKKNFRA